MSETNNTTKMKGNQYHHLTYEDRRKFLFEMSLLLKIRH